MTAQRTNWRWECQWNDGLNGWVDGNNANVLTVENVGADGSNDWLTVITSMKWRFENADVIRCKTSDKLSWSIYCVWHVSSFDWLLSWIETSLRLPCIIPIKTSLLFSFLHFLAETYCQSATVNLVRATHPYCHSDRHHIHPVHLVYLLLIQKTGKCSSSKSLVNTPFLF